MCPGGMQTALTLGEASRTCHSTVPQAGRAVRREAGLVSGLQEALAGWECGGATVWSPRAPSGQWGEWLIQALPHIGQCPRGP